MQNNLKAKMTSLNGLEEKASKKVFELIEKRGIKFPDGYDAQKALTNAFLVIKQDEKLYNCNELSIAHSLLNMVTLGLDIEHKQVYLIPIKNKMTLRTSYFGNQTALRRIKGVKDITSQVIYDGDEIDYDIVNGNISNLHHKSKFINKNNPIIGVYAVITLDEEIHGKSKYVEIMTQEEVNAAWSKGYIGETHKKFPQEMAKKTVINRACKNFVNTITDNNDVVNAYNEVIKAEYEDKKEEEIKEQNLLFLEEDEAEEVEEIEEDEIIFNDFEEKEEE